jgi:hypothetical protein
MQKRDERIGRIEWKMPDTASVELGVANFECQKNLNVERLASKARSALRHSKNGIFLFEADCRLENSPAQYPAVSIQSVKSVHHALGSARCIDYRKRCGTNRDVLPVTRNRVGF